MTLVRHGLAAATLLGASSIACAAPVDEDSASGAGSFLSSIDTTFAPASIAYPGAIVALPNGEILVADGDGSDPALVRLDATGARVGTARPSLGHGYTQPWKVTPLADGSYLAAIWHPNALIRFDETGAFDDTFAGREGGVVRNALPLDLGREALGDSVYALAVDAEGRVVVGGQSFKPAIARYGADFKLDPTFGDRGVARFEDAPCQRIYAVAPQPGGRVLAACRMSGSEVVMRVDNDGSLDPTFATDGMLLLDKIASGADEQDAISSFTFGAGGAIYAVGTRDSGAGVTRDGVDVPQTRALVVHRFTADGKPDMTFGTAGELSYAVAPEESLTPTVHIAPDGSVLVVATVSNPFASPAHRSDTLLVRFTSSGAVDTAFGTNGRSTFDLGGEREEVLSVAFDGAGRVLVGGVGDAKGFVARIVP